MSEPLADSLLELMMDGDCPHCFRAVVGLRKLRKDIGDERIAIVGMLAVERAANDRLRKEVDFLSDGIEKVNNESVKHRR